MNKIKGFRAISIALVVVFVSLGLLIYSCDSDNNQAQVRGFVLSGELPIEFTNVVLRSTGTENGIEILGTAQTDLAGFFRINYNPPLDPDAVLYITTGEIIVVPNVSTSGITPSEQVRLATVLGRRPVEKGVVINERTTVATAYTMAQFFTPDQIDGPYPGLQNAAALAENLVNLADGGVSEFLNAFPNGSSTSTRATFNSLANLLASCVRDENQCNTLFELSTPPGGTIPDDTLTALSNIARFPWQNVEEIFLLSQQESIYSPSLSIFEELMINAWTLALVYIGNGMELDGPGNIAFDADGNAWVCNNYLFSEDRIDFEGKVCGDDHVLRFTPTGDDAPGAPYKGGGLYGAGYGITLDPHGNVWVGNFGFQGTRCPNDFEALSQSVSKFAPDGIPISPSADGNDPGGFKGAGNYIRQPQGVVSDRDGNIWIANCSGDSVVKFEEGKPELDSNFQFFNELGKPLVQRPFDVAIDIFGNAWVSGNRTNNVIALDPEGNLLYSISGLEALEAGIILPMGLATDRLGNVWVANSGLTRIICDGRTVPELIKLLEITFGDFDGPFASIAMIGPDGVPVGPFKGGGLLVPWGMAVDGDGNVWVSNFDGRTLSHFCGAEGRCPPGVETGEPIAPSGYFFNGLERNTAAEIDPSGNVWMTNNWEIFAVQENPGGHQLVVFIGLAKPVQAPLIGPPDGIFE